MAGNESRSRDRKLVSSEPYEVEYIHSKFPGKSHAAVAKAIHETKVELDGSEDRRKIMASVRKKLG